MPDKNKNKIDPVCIMHGKKMSEHVCLYCCLCFKDLTPEECNIREDGEREDVCVPCAQREKRMSEEKTDHPGWKPEGFMRKQLSLEDANKLIYEIAYGVPNHFEKYGAGIFCHPHEIVGCMFGQQMKLSQAADESIYDGELQKFRTRCVKTLMAIFVGLASVDKLIELREAKNEAE